MSELSKQQAQQTCKAQPERISNLQVGAVFRIDYEAIPEWKLPERSEYGVLVDKGVGSVVVIMDGGDDTERDFTDHTTGEQVSFRESRDKRTRMAEDVVVTQLGINNQVAAAHAEYERHRLGRAAALAIRGAELITAPSGQKASQVTDMTPATATATTKVPDSKIKALQGRYNFQQKQFEKASAAGDEKKMEAAQAQMQNALDEAEALGVSLQTGETQAAPKGPQAVPTKDKAGKATKADDAKAGKEAAKVAKLAGKSASAGKKGAAKVKEPKVKKEKVLQACLDGCGQQVGGNFAMGHDAKLKSLILRIERGEDTPGSIPKVAQDLVKFKRGELIKEKDKEGKVKKEVQQFICTAAPVKIPGREDVQFTSRG
jgi:hypothetical protein